MLDAKLFFSYYGLTVNSNPCVKFTREFYPSFTVTGLKMNSMHQDHLETLPQRRLTYNFIPVTYTKGGGREITTNLNDGKIS